MAYIFKTNLANRSNYGSKRSVNDIKYIVIHYTANDGDTDENNGKYYANNYVGASAHLFVDDDSVTQSVPDNYVAWSVGGKKWNDCATTGGGKLYGKATNNNTLSIEICDDVRNGVVYPSAKTIENVIELTKKKMKEYNIPIENVIRHFDVNGKHCPAYWCATADKNAKWKTEFLNKLTDTTIKEEKEYYRVGTSWNGKCVGQVGAFTNKDNAIKKAKENKTWKVFDEYGKVVYEYKEPTPVVSAPATKPATNTATSTKPVKVNVTYAVQIEGGKVLPAVKNLTDYAGIENKKITGIAMKVDKGTIKYQVHVLGGKWLPWVTGYNWKDHNNGYAGNGRPIDAIRVYYSTPSDLTKNGDYREAKYHVSTIGNKNYYGWQLDDTVKNGMDGYAGAFGKAIDKVQIDIV